MKLNSIELEQNIIGSILINPKYCLPKCMEVISPDDFLSPQLRLIYTAMLSLDAKKKGIDAFMVCEELKTDLKQVGGASYVSSLADSVPSAENIEYYITDLRSMSKNRIIKSKIDSIYQNLTDGSDIGEEIDNFMKVVSDLRKNENSAIVRAGDLIGDVYDELQNGKLHGIKTGYEVIDKHTKGFQNQWLVIIAGESGKGKTTFCLNLCKHMGMLKNCLFFSCEMSSREILKKLISAEAEVESNLTKQEIMESPFLSKEEKENQLKSRMDATGDLSNSNIYFDDRPQTISTIYARAKDFKYKLESEGKTLDCIFVDYLQLVKPSKSHGNRESEVSEVADGLKDIAKEFNIPVIALAQTNRERIRAKRDVHNASDLRESAKIEQNADLIMFLNQDAVDMSKYIIDAVKFRHGSTFSMECTFLAKYSKFIEVKYEK